MNQQETIVAVREVVDRAIDGDGWDAYDGYEIETTKQTIFLGISNGQNCCEHWGYFATNDNPQSLVGQRLVSIHLTDENLSKKEVEELACLDQGGVMFVDVVGDRGVVQLAVYNAHNGYYGHSVVVQSDSLNYEGDL